MNIDQQIADSLERIVDIGERILAHLDQQQYERDRELAPDRLAIAEAKSAAFYEAIVEQDRATAAVIAAMVTKAA